MQASSRIRRVASAAIPALVVTAGGAQGTSDDVLGLWATMDPDTKVTLEMQLHMVGDRMHGRVVRVVDSQGRNIDPICERCRADGARQRVVGMTFIRGLRGHDGKWIDGRVVDVRAGPAQGFEAWCDLELERGRLRFMGYKWKWARGVPLLSRETEWHRVRQPAAQAN